MKQDNAYNHKIDRGWGKMQSILETEMPVKKKKNRKVFLWILFSGIFISLLLSQIDFLSTDNSVNQENPSFEQTQNMAVETSINVLQQESINEDKSLIQQKSENLSKEQSQIDDTGSELAFTNTTKKETSSNTYNQSTINKKPIIASTSTDKQDRKTSSKPKSNVPVLENKLNNAEYSKTSEEIQSDDSYVLTDNITDDKVENATAITNELETVLKHSKTRPLQLSIESIPTLASSLNYTRNNISKSVSLATTLPVRIRKDKARLFSGVSVAGIYSSPLNLKGWNAGLHLGLVKNKTAVSLYGKMGFLKRNGISERNIISGVETMEDDLTMGIDFDTMAQTENIVEKFKVLETGLSVDYNIMPRTFLNISSGIDYFYNTQAQNAKFDVAPGANANIFAINQISGPTTIEHSVVPFISLGMSYEFIKNLRLETYYKRQFKKPLRNLTSTSYVHQFNIGLKYFF